MLDASYFDGSRYEAYMRILGQQKEESEFKRKYMLDFNYPQHQLVESYNLSQSAYIYEKKRNSIEFFISEETYNKIIKIKWGAQYLYSTAEYTIVGNMIHYQLAYGVEKIEKNAEVALTFSEGDRIMAAALYKGGSRCVMPVIPDRDTLDNGQMKIATDLIVASTQLHRLESVNVAIVGMRHLIYTQDHRINCWMLFLRSQHSRYSIPKSVT